MVDLSFGDLFWLSIVVAGVAAEAMHRLELRRSRRAVAAELAVLTAAEPAGAAR